MLSERNNFYSQIILLILLCVMWIIIYCTFNTYNYDILKHFYFLLLIFLECLIMSYATMLAVILAVLQVPWSYYSYFSLHCEAAWERGW